MGDQTDPNRDDIDDPEEEEKEEEGTEEGTEKEDEEQGTEETDAERVTRLEEENERMRRALKKANREAAKRRIAAKESAATDDKKDSPELTAALEELKALREEKQRRASADVIEKQKAAVTKLAVKYKFLHPEDVVALAGIEFDPEDTDFDPADFEPSIKLLAKKRPELLNLGNPRDIDAKRQSSRGDELTINEDTIAAQYGIRTVSNNSKEK